MSPAAAPTQARIPLPLGAIEAFCRRWEIRELSLFGSVLREDFSPESDVDVLIEFDPAARPDLHDFMDMREELSGLLGRKVDLVGRGGLRNPFRRAEILRTRRVVYGA
jgi:uncharacterized protein